MKNWLQFWRISANVDYYLEYIQVEKSKYVLYENAVVLFILLAKCIDVLLLSIMEKITPFSRLLQLDLTNIINCSPNLNLAFASMWIQTIYFLYSMYQKSYINYKPFALIYQVICRKSDSFFLQKWMSSKSGKMKIPVHVFIGKLVKYYIAFLYNFVNVTCKY